MSLRRETEPVAECAGCYDILPVREMTRRAVAHGCETVDIGYWCAECDAEFTALAEVVG